MYKIVPCHNCGGRGYIVKSGDCSAWAEMCQDCKGEGTIQVKMTNADRIRTMSDEEMAKWLEYEGGGACAEVCGWLDWLRKPAEED